MFDFSRWESVVVIVLFGILFISRRCLGNIKRVREWTNECMS